LSFIKTARLTGTGVTLRTWQLYFFDVLLLGGLIAAAVNLKDLALFNRASPQVDIYWGDLTTLGVLGIYGFRLATYVAIYRRCRMPQVLEWWLVIIGFGFAAVLFIFGGCLLRQYASVQGYTYCHETGYRGSHYLFVRHSLACPAPKV
jgi:uncharacterized BrkB/YihY/UPF0761 family membrane protein